MKPSCNINKFCKIAQNSIIYEVTDGKLAIMDKDGTMGFLTYTDSEVVRNSYGDILDTLSIKKVEMEKREGLIDLLCKFIYTTEDVYSVTNTGILCPHIRMDGIYTSIIPLRVNQPEEMDKSIVFKYVASDKLAPFDYERMIGTRNPFSSVVVVCRDCFGVIAPIKMTDISSELYDKFQELTENLRMWAKIKEINKEDHS